MYQYILACSSTTLKYSDCLCVVWKLTDSHDSDPFGHIMTASFCTSIFLLELQDQSVIQDYETCSRSSDVTQLST